MDDKDLRFRTDSDLTGETRGLDGAPRRVEEKTEPAVGAQPATEAAPKTTTSDELGRQDPNANVPALAALEEEKVPVRPIEAAHTNQVDGSANDERRPRVDLLEHQLVMSVPTGFNQEKQSRLRKGAVDLYASLAPKDAIDAILARIMVGLNNATMDCFDRAVLCGNAAARGVNLRYGNQGSSNLIDIVKLYESRRGRGRQTFTVAQVNVEAGGQAIVGNVQTGDGRKQKPKPESVPRSATKKSGS